LFAIAVSINPNRFNDLFREQGLPATWTAAVIDKNLVMAGRTGEADRFVGVKVAPTLAEKIASGAEGMFPTTKYDGSVVETVYSRSPDTGWAVAIGIPEQGVWQPLRMTLLMLVLSGGALMALSLIATAVVARSIVKNNHDYELAIIKSNDQLAKANDDYERLVANIPVGVYKARAANDGELVFEFCSERFHDILDISREVPGTQIDAVMREKIVAEDRPTFDRAVEEARTNMKPFVWEGRIRCKEKIKWIHLESIGSKHQDFQLREGVVRDITRNKEAEQKAFEEHSKYKSLFNNAHDGIFIYDKKGFIDINLAGACMFGTTAAEMIGRTPMEYCPEMQPNGRSSREFGAEVVQAMLTDGTHQFEWQCKRKDGSLFDSEITLSFISLDGKHCALAILRDITDRKKAEETIWQQANFDALTGLPNRRMFHDRLSQEIKKAHRAERQLGLLFIDLDNFKEINDTLGHHIGDLLLIEVAKRISQCVRQTDTVARMGGDEFTVLLTELEDAGNAERVAFIILEQLAEPFSLDQEKIVSSASIGITLYPTDASEVEDLLKHADQAMYDAKRQGRNRFSYFTPALRETAQHRQKLIHDLREATSGEQLRVVFQPIVDLANGQIHKAEALVRWLHPQRGLISPAEFIPLAEETGLILEIGDWVFHESTRWLKRWQDISQQKFQMSINKSPVQFYRDIDCDRWLGHLRKSQLSGESVVIEITESLMLKSDTSIMESLLAYRDNGIQVAIDDFGTGYSSLSYINKFDIDYLKIDQSFTRNLAPESRDLALSEAIIVMAHKLGLKVIAEGVETVQQRDLLLAIDCDYAQGYLFSKPLPPEEFEEKFLS
jgi:diguanylate cyclase (GGDEF)-like protein/PAS domain S-box-containing protein